MIENFAVFGGKGRKIIGIGGLEHRVPLPKRAVEILRAMHEVRINEYVFPGQGVNKDGPITLKFGQ